MKVSFVIPTRNQAAFLRRCLDSCLAQAILDREVIVVDGASTDDTRSVLQEYTDRIRAISEPDRGQSDALNKGVAMAAGEIIAWLNSDDYYPAPDVLPAVLARFECQDDLDILYGDGLLVDPAGRPLRAPPAHPLTTARQAILLSCGFVLQPALFFRRRIFLDAGGADVRLHYCMDLDLWIRMLPRARRVDRVERCLACATYHPAAKSVKQLKEQVEETVAMKRRHARASGLGLWDQLRLARGNAELHLYSWLVRHRLWRAP